MKQAAKNAVKTAYAATLCATGALAGWLRLRPGRRHPWILNYHHIDPEPFDRHLAALARHYHIVTLDACCAYLAGEADLPPNSVVLTFDDGYEQVYTELFPLLEKHGAPATLYVPTAPVDEGGHLWFNRVKTFVRTTDAASVALGDRRFALDGGREAAYVAVMRHLTEQDTATRDAMLAALLDSAELPPDRMARYRLLSWEQIAAMRGLVTVGGHTRTHPCLSHLSRAEAEEEIAGAKARLEEALGEPVRHFAYPFGGPQSFTAETVEIVRSAGFVSAVTTSRGACRPGASLHTLPRILFDGSVSGRIVAARLSGLWLFVST